MIVQIKRGEGAPGYLSQVAGNYLTDNSIYDGQLGFDLRRKDLFIGDKDATGYINSFIDSNVVRFAGHGFTNDAIFDWLGDDNLYQRTDAEGIHKGKRRVTQIVTDYLNRTQGTVTFNPDGTINFGAEPDAPQSDYRNLFEVLRRSFVDWERYGKLPGWAPIGDQIPKTWEKKEIDDYTTTSGNFGPNVDYSNDKTISGWIDYNYARQEYVDDRFEEICNQLTKTWTAEYFGNTFVRQEVEHGNTKHFHKQNSTGVEMSTEFDDLLNEIILSNGGQRLTTKRISNANARSISMSSENIIFSKGGTGPTNDGAVFEVAGGQIWLGAPGGTTERPNDTAVTYGQFKDLEDHVRGEDLEITVDNRLSKHDSQILKLFGLASEATFVAFKRNTFAEIEALPGSFYYNPFFYENIGGPTGQDGFPTNPTTNPSWVYNREAWMPAGFNYESTLTTPKVTDINDQNWVSGVIKGDSIRKNFENYKAYQDAMNAPSGSLDKVIVEAIIEHFDNQEEIVWRPRNGTQFNVPSLKGLYKIGLDRESSTKSYKDHVWKYWTWDFGKDRSDLVGTQNGFKSTTLDAYIKRRYGVIFGDQRPGGKLSYSTGAGGTTATVEMEDIVTFANKLEVRVANYWEEPGDEHRQGRIWYNSSDAIDPTTGRPFYMDWQYMADRVNVPDGVTTEFDNEGYLRIHENFVLNQGRWQA